jgi:hypothetical protein
MRGLPLASGPLLLLLFLAGGCGKDEAPTCKVTPPTTWTAPQWAANTAEALALRGRLDALVGTGGMRDMETGALPLGGVADLNALYNAGAPSLASITGAAFAPVVSDAFDEFVGLVAAGAQDLVDAGGKWAGGAAGGRFGTSNRGMNKGGIEIRQVLDKGLYGGGAFYAYALQRTAGSIDEASIDSLAAIWGSNASLDPNGRQDAANYSYAQGFHGRIRDALIAAKAYAADAACTAQRDDALRSFFAGWEAAMFARAVFYANFAVTELASATGDDDIADALHELSEGLVLALSFRGVAAPGAGPLQARPRVSTDAQIEAMLTSLGLNVADLSASTTGSLAVDTPSAFAAKVVELETVVKSIFSLTDADIAAIRQPTAG